MSIFDAFKKKKAKPMKPLETPPGPQVPGSQAQEEIPQQDQQVVPQSNIQGAEHPFSSFQDQQFGMESPQEQAPGQDSYIQPTPMPEFSLPPQQGYIPGQFQDPEHINRGPMYPPADVPMPAPPSEEEETPPIQEPIDSGAQSPMHSAMQPGPQQPAQPQFKFYQAATPEEVEQEGYPLAHPIEQPIMHQESDQMAQDNAPFDVSQELLTLPEVHRKEHPELYHEGAHTQELHARPKKHISKEFIPITNLFEIGEQLSNLGEDLLLAKDTSFRLTDLNEQEIEKMAKWHTLHQSIELRLAEVDKLLFKTNV
jgi:hypothetical protein